MEKLANNYIYDFLLEYASAVEAEIDYFGRERFCPFDVRCELVVAYIANDGVAVFYLAGTPVNAEPGLYVYDYSQYTVNRIVQSLHLNRLQFATAEVGDEYQTVRGPIQFTDPLPGIETFYFSDEIRESFLAGTRDSIGVTVTPRIQIKNNVVTDVSPGRVKLWSPIVNLQGNRVRYFAWNHADIWWRSGPNSLSNAVDAAKKDVLAIRLLMTHADAFQGPNSGPDKNSVASTVLDREIEEFISLLDRNPDEHVIHGWLKCHQHFVSPLAKRVLSKVRFGQYYSDFVVEHADQRYELIEIEGVQRVFTKSDEPSSQFNHALRQVKDWIQYVRDNVHTVRDDLKLHGIYQPTGRVIMGRSKDINGDVALRRWRDIKSDSIAADTYDDIIERMRQLSCNLAKVVG